MQLFRISSILVTLLLLALASSWQKILITYTHNLQTRMVSMFLDEATLACLDARLDGTALPPGCDPLPAGWGPGDPVLQAGDELGLIIKVEPRDGTPTGVGGHIDFYVPNGVQVIDAAYLVPDYTGGFLPVNMKGQSPIAIGDGPVGGKATAELIDPAGWTGYTNINGVTENPVVPASGLHRGTVAGVYGDTGIFYSTDPDTAYGSWQKFTGDWNASGPNRCGSLAFTLANGKTLTNNSGDTVVPCNKWDAEQLYAWGVKGTTYTGAGFSSTPIVDYGDGRGNAPWGFASGVAGPQSGYAWNFDWDEWAGSSKDAAAMRGAMSNDEIGPWQRIKYPGSRVSYDQPGLDSIDLGFASIDAGNLGRNLVTNPLPATTSQTDSTSPKAIRWAVGQLTEFNPEYAWVKIKVDDITEIVDPTGCPVFHADTFGGDAGGTDNGKDHLWRYYEPTEATWNGCLAIQKPASRQFVSVGDVFQYEIKVYNLQDFAFTSVVVKDTLPSGVRFISALPFQDSGPNPLVWNVGTLLPGEKFEATVTVEATSTGFLDNVLTVYSYELPPQAVTDTTGSGLYPFLVPSKSVRQGSVAPGDTVIYDILVRNIGTGPSGNPVTIQENLPSGFTYDPSYTPVTYVNGALITATVDATNPGEPKFTVPASVQSGNQLTISFQAKVPEQIEPGDFCNSYTVTIGGVPKTTGSEACVTVAGGKIGDTIWRDWDGDGVQDAGEEGISGVTVNLYAANGTTLLATTTTDANGNYYFNGLQPGTYVVKVNGGTPLAGYTQTGDPDQPGVPCTTCDGTDSAITLTENQQYFAGDFGYKPTGTASIGDKVFEDVGNDGTFTSGTDTGINGVTVWLYEDTNGDGVITPGVDALVATTTTDASGNYLFSNLAGDPYDYLVKVDKNDPDIQSYFNGKYDPDPVPYQISTAEVIPSPNLTGSDLDNDFGFWKVAPASIGDQVFIDLDGDGLYDAGETPVSGVTVNLYRDGVLVATTVSGPDGKYLFGNLGPGTYTVKVDTASEGVPDGYSASVAQYTVAVAAGQNYLLADFPFVPLISKTVNKSYVNPTAGESLTFNVNVNYPGSSLLSDVRVVDPFPAGLLAPPTVGQGGSYGAYVPLAGIPGQDSIPGPSGSLSGNIPKMTHIRSDQTGRNYGSCVTQDLQDTRRILLQFDTAAIPAGADIDAATISLFRTGGQANPSDIGAFRLTQSWNEGNDCDANGDGTEATWNTSGTAAWSGGAWVDSDGTANSTAAPYDTVTVSNVNQRYVWDVSGIAQQWSGGASNYGVILIQLGNQDEAFASDDYTTNTSDRPTYTVNYTQYYQTTNTLTVSANTVAIGNPLTVTMTLTSTTAISNIVPGTLSPSGPGSCAAPTLVSANDDLDGTPGDSVVYQWSCTLTGTGDYTFSADAGNGSYTFTEATSPSVLATIDGSTQVVTWNLGSSDAGTTGISAQKTYIYALRGDTTDDFWIYNTNPTRLAWNVNNAGAADDPTDTPVTVKEGGALATDGVRYIYALAGAGTRTFMRYDAINNIWDNAGIADLPVTTDKAVLKGGALVYLNGYVYAFIGNDSAQFWRYSVSGNSWTQMTSAPQVINEGGALTTDGTNIYALRGKRQKSFWRYNVASNTWTPLQNTLDNIGKGGSLVYADGAIYATRGDAQKSFYRYNLTNNTWTRLADAPNKIDQGGALAYDGTYIYALRGNSNNFYRYDPANNQWSTDWSANTENAPATVKWGGAIRFLATGAVTRVRASASPALVSGTKLVTIRMTTTSNDVVSNVGAVDPPTWTVTPGSGITATKVSGPTLVSSDDDISGTGDPVIYEWTYSVTAGTAVGEIVFTTTNTVAGTQTSAKANSVIVTPTLTYTATVNNPAPAVIYNTAILNETSGAIQNVPSNTTETYSTATIGDYVWADLDGDGLQDAGELGLSGVKVYVDSNGNGVWDAGEPYDITDASGQYRISGLTAGTYTVRTDPATYPAGYVPTTTDSLSVPLTAGQQYFLADFGLQPPPLVTGSIGDYLWLDADNDGVQDPGEAPLPGITVRLYRDLDNDGFLDPGEPLVAVDVTDADGLYTFAGLPFANYIVVVDQDSPVISPYDPLGSYTLGGVMDATYDRDGGTATPDGVTAVNVSSATPITDVDFGYNWSGQIGDRTWYDTNRDGVQDGGEASAAFVTMVLYNDLNGNGKVDPGEPLVTVVETDASGAYLVDNLPPGNYVMDPDEQTVQNPVTGGYSQMVPSTGEYLATTLSAGDMVDLDLDAGFFAGALIEGYVFHDVDSGGVKDGGEPGLANITVTLTGTDDQGNPISETTTTNAEGEYVFLVPPGTYTITYDTADPDIPSELGTETTPTSTTFTAVGGQEYAGSAFNFGRDNTGSIGDLVWNDADGDGFKDGGESGIPGVTLQLYTDPNGDGDPADGVLIDSQATDANGKYLFDGLEDGNYVVVVDETALSGYTQTGDPDEGMIKCVTCDARSGATVTSGGATLGEDFGYQTPGFHVGGTLWNDNGAGGGTAGDGVQNGTEPGIAGVTVCIYEDDGVTLVACTTTAGNGDYEFSGIPNGDYIIRVDEDTFPSDAFGQTGDPDATKDNQTSITVAGGPVVDKDFGYKEYFGSISGTVVGTVANPADGDGVAEAGEGAHAGVTVFLTYAGNDGILGTEDDVVSSRLTDGAGNYSFTNLEPGIYQVTKTNPTGYTSLADGDGGNPNNITVNLNYGPDGIPGTADDRMTAIDRDFEVEPPSGSIGDSVWLDVDRDGIQDIGEPGLANVTVELAAAYEVIDGAIDVNGDGFITVDDDGWLRGIQVINGLLDVNGNGSIDVGDDGVFFGTPVIDGLLDINGDGFVFGDGGYTLGSDSGYTGGDTIATETTDMQGHYLFTSVPPGDYLVLVNENTLPGEPGDLTETAGTTNASSLITLAAGETDLDVDFGYVPASGAVIGNFVWSDADNDGEQDPGEPGIGGVTLRLLDEFGNPVDDPNQPGTQDFVVTTNPDGSYYFFGVLPGKYRVEVTDTSNVLSGYSLTIGSQSSTDPTAAITVGAGTIYDKADFGYYNPSLYSITDRAWYDANRNGIVDPGETGIEGVTVDLVLDENGDGIVDYEVISGRIDLNGDGKITSADDGSLGGFNIIDGFIDLSGNGSIGPEDDSATYGTYDGISVIDGVLDLNGTGDVPDNTGSIGDLVWLDTNGDGIKGANETGLSGVTVNLYGADGTTLLATTTTDAQGNYVFDGLAAGSYYVGVSGVPANLTYTTYDGTTGQIDLVSGQTYTGADFGYKPDAGTAAIGDRIWSDADGDGTQDAGEVGIGGVTVQLYDCGPNGICGDGDDVGVVATTTTAADGSYLFTNVAPGTYKVVVPTPPSGYTQTGDPDATKDSQSTVTVAAGDLKTNLDFGYRDTTNAGGFVGDTVFEDLNGNGVQDDGEPGIAGVTVNLYASDGMTLIATTTTSPSGVYSFTGLPVTAGGVSYVVEVTDTRDVLANATATADPDETGVCVTCDYRASTTLYTTGSGTGPTDYDVDFGFYFEDSGTISPEPVIASTLSDADGYFSFDGLENGDYVISVSDNAGDLTNFQGTTAEAQAGEAGVTVSGSDIQGESFGYSGLGPIGDRIWNDADGDGVQDAGELGIEGVTVELFIDDGDGVLTPCGTAPCDTLLYTTTTDAYGNYEFNDLPAGTFFVRVTQPSGYDQTGDPDQPGVPCTTCDNVIKVTLNSTEPSFLEADFGYQSTTPLADVSGTVWRDPNRNAVLEAGEPGFAGVTVALVDSNGNVVATTTTDANGNYTFADVPAGNYTVVVTDNANVLNGFFLTSGLDEIPVTVGTTDVTDVNFGYARQTGTGSIGDSVWIDSNNDGVFQPNESGISGVTVNLYSDRNGDGFVDTTVGVIGNELDLNGDGFVDADDDGYWYGIGVSDGGLDTNGDGLVTGADDATVTVNGTPYTITDGFIQTGDGSIDGAWDQAVTDSSGTYLFDGLPAGNYEVDVISGVPANLVPSAGTTDPSGVINLSDGESYLDADFGYRPASGYAVLGDTVWYDVDGDGLQDASEIGIGGVDVRIVDLATQEVVAIVTTNPDGTWLAVIPEDATLSQYAVQVDSTTLPGGLITTPTNLGDGDTYLVSVKEGDVRLNLDFGYEGGAGGVIGDQVFLDANKNGVWDAGEGLSGVTLKLYSIEIIDGKVDVNGDGIVDSNDDGFYGDYAVVDGVLQSVPPNTSINGMTVIGGLLDVNHDGVIGTNDDLEPAALSTTVTDQNGTYLFDGLLAGDYRVEVTGGLPEGLTLTAGSDPTSVITLSDAESYLLADFGYQPAAGTSVIGDRVWSDADGDGVQDSGEAGIKGVTVFFDYNNDGFLDWTDSNGNGVWDLGEGERWTTTDADGSYLFTNVAPGTYTVATLAPAGSTPTGDPDEPGICTTCDNKTSVTVSAGDTWITADFGYQNTAAASGSIGDTVYEDSNGNGVQDGGELGIDGVTLNLVTIGAINGMVDVNGDGTITSTDDAPSFGGDKTVVDGVIYFGGSPYSGDLTINGITYAVIGGKLDINGNGSIEGSDYLIPQIIATTTTAGGGLYDFTGLPAGDYRVEVTDTSNQVADMTATQVSGDAIAITCSGGTCTDYNDADFGFADSIIGSGRIGDTLYFDTDGDETQDAGELGIGGVTLDLVTIGIIDGYLDLNGDGQITTADDGTYGGYPVTDGSLVGVTDGTYVNGIKVLSGRLDINGDNSVDTGDDQASQVVGTTTTSNGTTDVDGDGNIDPAGTYEFDGLSADAYRVVVTDTNNVLGGLTPTQKAGAVDVTCSGGTCTEYLGADFGYKSTTGGTGTLGGTIWHDTVYGDTLTEQGVLNSGEPLLQGVTVELWVDVNNNGTIEPGTDNLVRTTTTNSNGEYLFLGLPPANYIVNVTDTNGVLTGMTNVTGPSPDANNNGHIDPYATTLTLGEVDTSIDFGYKAVAGTGYSISGTVFEDAGTSLGTYDDPAGGGDDAYAPGATVYLYRVVNGQQYLIGTTTTAVDGSYSFTDLPAGGTYVVKVDTTGTLVEGFEQTVDPDYPGIVCTTCDSQWTVVNLSSNQTNINFGYWNGGIVTTPVTLAYFKATPGGKGTIHFEWWTATETGNLGFELYTEVNGEAIRINPEPILGAVSSTEPVQYTYTAEGLEGDTFWIVDVDIDGKRTWHGPYEFGRPFGHKPKAEPIDWKSVKKEKDSKKAARDIEALNAASVSVELAAATGGTADAVNLVVLRDPLDASYARVTYSTSARVYRITYEALVAAGMNLSNVRADRLTLYNQGQPVPIGVFTSGSGKGKDLFGPGSYLEFVGVGAESLYTDANPYRLVIQQSASARVTEDKRTPPKNFVPVPYYMETVTREREWDYAIESPNGDPWYDEYLAAWGGPSGVLSRSINVDQYVPGAAPAELEVGLWGVSSLTNDPDHHVIVGFNGSSNVADKVFDGRVDGTVKVILPQNLLTNGANTVTLQLPFDLDYGLDEYGDPGFDMIALDRYSVTYPRLFAARNGRLSFTAAGAGFTVEGLPSSQVVVYRVDSSGVARLSGVQVAGSGNNYMASFPGLSTPATYHVAAVNNLGVPVIEPVTAPVDCSQGGEAEYLVISHEDFISADLSKLIAAREAEGYSSAIVPVGGLHSQYTYGMVDPSAIQACVRDAVNNRGTQAVLLVGADSYDYMDYFEVGSVSFIPSFYTQTGNIVHWAPVDSLFGDVDGDGVQDVALGRFPVRNSTDLANMVERTLEYGTKSYERTAVFAADRYDVGQTHDFRADSEAILAELPDGWTAERAYVDDLGVPGAKSELIGAINNGVALTAFIGHSGPNYWTFDGLFNTYDASVLQNAGKPTVVAQWGCWNTFYVSPFSDSLGHAFLLSGARGAAAVLGASTLTEADHETEFGQRLFGIGGLANDGTTIGGAVLNAKRSLAAEYPEWLDVILGWQLLGDPLLKINP